MTSSPISIFVLPPSEDQCERLDFGDGPMVDPPCDAAEYVRYLRYLSGPFHSSQQVLPERSDKHIPSGRGVPGDQVDIAPDHYSFQTQHDSHPFPFGSLPYNAPQFSAEDFNSPYSSTPGDSSSDFSPGTSPSINDGTLSSSHSGTEDPPRSADSLLSPTLLNNLTLPFTEMNLDNTQPMSVFRVRSHSVTERTVSPSETWCDPAARSGVRSAPSTIAPLPYDALADYTASSHVNECSFYQHGDGTFSPVNEVSPLTSIDGLYPGVCQVAGPEQTIYHNTGSGLLLQPDDIRSCPPLKPEMQSDPCISTHHRGHSDPSGYLSPTSPVDQRGDRMHHRRSGSVFKSRRHAPYPASAPSTPEGGFVLPELAEGHLTQRRYSGHSPSRPKLTVDVAQSFQGQQVMASPYQTPWRLDQAAESPHVLHVVKTEWDQANGISHPLSSPQLVHVMPGQPPMYVIDDQPSPSPSSAISSASPSPGYKDIVGSQKIVDASSARRKRDGKFKCDWPNCEQTFTAKHNLQYHILSHNKVRPFQCGKCEDSFTTPGVANRHRAKCTGSEKNTRRRRSATSVAPPSAHASTSR